jgi:hypothetical protein
MKYYNEERTYSGKYCFGKTPIKTFLDTLSLAKKKKLDDACRQLSKKRRLFVR